MRCCRRGRRRYGGPVTVANDSAGGAAASTGFTVSVELSMALAAQGPHGERALNLLRDAAAVLSDPTRWNAPYEASEIDATNDQLGADRKRRSAPCPWRCQLTVYGAFAAFAVFSRALLRVGQ